MPRLLLLGALTFTSLVQQNCPWCSRTALVPAPPCPGAHHPVDGTGRRKVMKGNTAKSLAHGDGSLPAYHLRAGQSMAGKRLWMAQAWPAREEDARERHSFATAESKATTAAEKPRRSFSVWLKAAISLPEASAFFCLCPKPILFTQEMQLAVSPVQQLCEYCLLIVISAWWLSLHFINLYLVFKLAGLVSWSA